MTDTGIRVQNFKEVRAALRNVGVPAQAVKAAATESAQSVVTEAKSLVPVRSGRLRDSIRVKPYANGRISMQAGNNRKSRSGVPYANPIHWGWFKRNILPQPFMSKALGYKRAEIYDNYFKQLGKLIEEESRKAKA